MDASTLELWWGSPASALAYNAELLSDADKQRVSGRTAPKPKLDWEVSRALMQAADLVAGGPPLQWGLSHSRGHAICVVGRGVEIIGVDLEARLPRDVLRLASWCCTDDECAMLAAAQEPRRSELFYTLWTIKESFVKAANLDFPGDMRRNGLAERNESGATTDKQPTGYRLITQLPGEWHAASYALDEKWTASVVWRSKPGQAIEEINWLPGPYGVLPTVRRCGRWASSG
jgi:4'-phosphopantetheinyl transferase